MTVQAGAHHDEELLASAADWVLRLRDPMISPAAIAEWIAWCDSAPQNKEAFARMHSLWQDMGEIDVPPVDGAALAADDYEGEVSVRAWRHGARGRSRSAVNGSSRRAKRLRYAGAVAATAAVVAMTVFVIDGLQRRDVVVVTRNGASERVELPDGSHAIVAGGSRMATHYTEGERSIFLEHGEAYFQVRKDPRRPFVVHALSSSVTAVGTAFNVRAELGTVQVAVTEGVVEMGVRSAEAAPAPQIPGDNIRIEAGNQAVLSAMDTAPRVSPVDPAQAISWVSGTLKFVDEPMSQVVAAVNRNSTRRIQLAQPALGEYRFTGTVVAARLDEWLRGLPNIFPVSVHDAKAPDAGGVTVIERRDEPPAAPPFAR